MQKPSVAVVIVTWNSAQDIAACLRSLEGQDYDNFRIVVGDNASSDDTTSIVKSQFPSVELVEFEQNLYFAGGNNALFQHVLKSQHPDYIAILNPDTLVSPNWLSSQVEIMESDSQIGAVGPKVLFAEEKTINSAGILAGGYLFPYDRGYGEIDKGQFDQQQEVYALSGVSILFRSETIHKVGGFYSAMQMYLEDVDLCLRISRAGYRIIYTPSTVVLHKHMQSTKQAGSARYTYWSNRNYLLLLLRNYSFKKFLRGVVEISKSQGIMFALRCTLSALRIRIWATSSSTISN